MPLVLTRPDLASAARTAELLLRDLPERWAHTAGVAHRAAQLSASVAAADRELLVAAAWLHDIGYHTELAETGFHPLDGASWLHRQGWPEPVCALVAHHSGARFAASARGLTRELARYPFEVSPVTDALTYADQTVGPYGRPMAVADRMAEVLARHGADSVQARIHHLREPYLLAVAGRVERRLAAA
ncbi:metal-dependent phosphohydrolase, HD subdomain protein [Catellatospora sp. TT07R-123]|uniref:HD domain-containing protein n=1 Tax=Catellatospora sp. TT07R-123 TaxID=2733863 RepID=UPI001B176C29|nr:HD domain-containing protein [Catellatospora sp. TT07R-123]GHJ49221.1 metal-dependent phosphohydrolase, HD subdomain protein [Catellatospora sp. TT07R-123]